MDDDEEFDLAEFLEGLQSQQVAVPVWRVRPIDFAVWGAAHTAMLLQVVADAAAEFSTLLLGQANHDERQARFADEVRLDLEHINEGDD